MIEPVTDPGDPRLEPYRDVRERDLVGRQGLYIAEGRVVLEKLIAARPGEVQSLLLSEARLAGAQDLIAGLPPATPVYVAGQAVMDAVVGFPIHRGMLGVARRAPADAGALLGDLQGPALVVGLVAIANHDNMGGIFRNAAAFGADAVLLDETCCDPLYRKSIRVSVGAALTVPHARASDAAALVSRLQDAGFEVVALSPRGEGTLAAFRPGPRTAILLGAEGPGLPEAVMTRVRTLRIPMAGDFDSLNVATTSGIVLHHLAASRAG